MSGLQFSINAPGYHFQSKLDSRITFALGDSGVGKTFLVDIINESYGSESIEIVCEKDIITIVDRNQPIRTTCDTIEREANVLFILDDNIFSSQKEFYSAYYNSDVSNWFLIFARDRIPKEVNTLKLNNLHFGVDSYKDFIAEGINHYLKNHFVDDVDYKTMAYRDYTDFSALTEDTKTGLAFWESFYSKNKVYPIMTKSSVSGKDIINDVLFDLLGSGIDSTLTLLIIDMSAFGPYIFELESTIGMFNAEDSFVYFYCYESFEYMLLCSNAFKCDDLYDTWDREKYETFEQFCEARIFELSDNTRYKYKNKRKLNDCWTEACGSLDKCRTCTEVSKDCSGKIYTKSDWLLHRTKFQFFLVMKYLAEDKFVWTDEDEDEE